MWSKKIAARVLSFFLPVILILNAPASSEVFAPSFSSHTARVALETLRLSQEALANAGAVPAYAHPANPPLAARIKRWIRGPQVMPEETAPDFLALARGIPIQDAHGIKPLKEVRDDFIAKFLSALHPRRENGKAPANSGVSGKRVRQDLFRAMNGIAAIPLLFVLSTQRSPGGGPALLQCLNEGPKTLMEISRQFNPGREAENMGYKGDALYALAQQGWIHLTGKDQATTYSLTPRGSQILELAEAHAPLLKFAANSVINSMHYRTYYRMPPLPQVWMTTARRRGPFTATATVVYETVLRLRTPLLWMRRGAALREYQQLTELSGRTSNRWGLPDDSQHPLAVQEFRSALDAMVMSRTMTALGMPSFEVANDRLQPVDLSLTQRLRLTEGNLDVEQLAQDGFDKEFLTTGFTFFSALMPFGPDYRLATFDGRQFKVLPWGLAVMDREGGHGIATSYDPGSIPAVLRAMMFDPDHPDPIGIRNRGHITQLVNSWGAHLQHLNLLTDLLQLALPLVEAHTQGFSEWASGDGNIVATLSAAGVAWREVLARYYTTAGQLEEARRFAQEGPFIGLSTDYDRELLPRETDVFRRMFEGIAPNERARRFRHIANFADIGHPEALAKDVLPMQLKDLLHVFMFAFEERDFPEHMKDPASAAESIRNAADLLEHRLHRSLPGDEHLREELRDLLGLGPQDPFPQGEEFANAVIDQFHISHSHYGKHVPTVVAIDDLIEFAKMFRSLAATGILVADVCTPPLGSVNQDEDPLSNTSFAFTSGFREKIHKQRESRLAYLLAGYQVPVHKEYPDARRTTIRLALLKYPDSPLPYERGTVTLNDGRKIGYAEYGDPRGIPVLYFPGSLGSAYEAEMIPRASLRGIRLIAVERPGIGLSSPYGNHSLGHFPRDIEEFADRHLGVDSTFALFSFSGAGPYALSCATDDRLAKRLLSAVVNGTPGSLHGETLLRIYPAIASRYRKALDFLQGNQLPLLEFCQGVFRAVSDDERWSSLYSRIKQNHVPADQGIFDLPGMEATIRFSYLESFRQGIVGWALDMVALVEGWRFNLKDVKVPVHFVHGDQDNQVPHTIALGLHLQTPGSELHLVEGKGHRLLVEEAQWMFRLIVEDAARHPSFSFHLKAAA